MIRSAGEADVAAVHALERELFGADAWSEASVREELTGPRRVALVAVAPGLRGYVVTAAAGDAVDVQRIGVHPASRRQGVARALLAAALERSAGCRVLLEVAAGNTGALAFYTAEGFIEVARRRRYYRDGSDALVLERPPDGRMGA